MKALLLTLCLLSGYVRPAVWVRARIDPSWWIAPHWNEGDDNLWEVTQLIGCIDGPAVWLRVDCWRYDLNKDLHVDMKDVAILTSRYKWRKRRYASRVH